ncbi:hypothetical protein EA462_09920 [Natrarchaeobius halalkaliphilus]|uniref:Uncharacterized protein n=1 Tax=Natrarchaeobius halalkaliphilus TaxID=1679091 RepID=A0A3N6P4H2_9EURY|nr:hypothetical protein [Natrarchaeobius halalkaliphilus]RQG90285.1 hypothetical protein EA462_09920 [Natrarchaeobius halalkaliphilus]
MTRERPDPSRSAAIDRERRGQTTQDFVVGIGIFVLAVAFVFTTVPSFVATPTGSIDGGDTAQIDRVAATIVSDLETETPNELDGEAFNRTYSHHWNDENATEWLGLRTNADGDRFDRVNVTVRNLALSGADEPVELESGVSLAAGDTYRNQTDVRVTRIVTVTDINESGDLEQGDPLRLEVRMW